MAKVLLYKKCFIYKVFCASMNIKSLTDHITVQSFYCRNSLVPLKQLSSAPTQDTVALQVPARLSAELTHPGHCFPFTKALGTGDV